MKLLADSEIRALLILYGLVVVMYCLSHVFEDLTHRRERIAKDVHEAERRAWLKSLQGWRR